jgi:hypothetical protein
LSSGRQVFSTCSHSDFPLSKLLQSKKDEFPTLFRLAMDILPIQASSVPCERVFSSSKETTTARRSSLSPNLVEALQVLKFERRQARTLTFTEGLDKDEEVAELEALEEGRAADDEDLSSMFERLM